MGIYDQIITDGFGLVNIGRNLGLFYAPRDHMAGCPKGWLFIACEDKLASSRIKEMVAEFMSIGGTANGS